jgi:hypothetical protein
MNTMTATISPMQNEIDISFTFKELNRLISAVRALRHDRQKTLYECEGDPSLQQFIDEARDEIIEADVLESKLREARAEVLEEW